MHFANDRSERVRALMDAAMALPAAEWPAYLAARCPEDPAIVDEVLQQLREIGQSDVVEDYIHGRSADSDDEAYYLTETGEVRVFYNADGARRMVERHGPIVSIELAIP